MPTGATLTPELKYRLLLELSRRISRTLELQPLLSDLIALLREALPCDAAGVFVLNGEVPLLEQRGADLIAGMVQVGFDAPVAGDPMLRSGLGIVGHVIRSGETVRAPDVRRDARYVAGRRSTLSELAVPIVIDEAVVGCLNVESDREAAFSEADAELLAFFASAAALSIQKALLHRQVLEKQRIEQQLEVARAVQASLLPARAPRVPGYEIAAVNLPTGGIGGDYYDYLPLPSGQLGLAIADVSGKGIPAALIMASFRASLRHELRQGTRDLAGLAGRLNETLLESREGSRFVTGVCLVLDPASGRLDYVNCGHNPPLLLRRDGAQQLFDCGGPALGLFAGPAFEPGTGGIAPGDRLVLYTDGVVELCDAAEEEFGVARLASTVRAAGAAPPAELVRRVLEATRAHSGREPYEDDFTLVVLSRE
jgi:sigma-B regulation protein RsbU (phosphoserine phosphatase)